MGLLSAGCLLSTCLSSLFPGAQETERFFEELEEDADMRSRVAIYKAPKQQQKGSSVKA